MTSPRQLVSLTALETGYIVELHGLTELEVALFVESWSRCGARLERAVGGSDARTILRAYLGGAEPPGGGGELDVIATSYAELCDRLTGLITRRAIFDQRNHLLMFHAGAVADPRTGAVVAFIGPSGRGKTTASMRLAQRFGYVSDETVAVRDDLTIVAYPKPLSVVVDSEAGWKRQLGPDAAALEPLPTTPLHLVGLVLLDRAPGYPRAAPMVTAVSLSAAVEDLVPQVSFLPERPAPLRRLRDLVVAVGGLHRLRYGEADTLGDAVQALFDVVPSRPRREAVIERRPIDDSILDNGSLIILSRSTVRVLNGISPTIWNAASSPISRTDLVDTVVSIHGFPPDADAYALVDDAVAQLSAAGLLSVSDVTGGETAGPSIAPPFSAEAKPALSGPALSGPAESRPALAVQ